MPATTIPAGPISYLQAVASGATKAQGLKRPTVAALQQAAKALGLPDRIHHVPSGYHVGHGYNVSPCSNLKEAAAVLLRSLERGWAVKPAAPARSLAPYAADLGRSLGLASGGRLPAARRGPLLPGETAAPAPVSPAERVADEMLAALSDLSRKWEAEAPAPAPAPTLPELPETSRFASGRFDGLQPWGSMPGYVTQSQQQQQPQQAPAPVVAPGPKARATAPAAVPADVKAHLARFGLAVDGLLTVGASNAKLAKGKALAWPVILHHLPAKALAQAVAGPKAGPTAPRSRIDGLQALAERENVLSLALAHNGCPWASKGCAAGCLAWAGHGGMSTTVAAARARRTLAMLADGRTYARAVLWAIARAYRQAQAKGLPLAVRLRGTDDSPIHLWRFDVTAAEAQSLARRYGLPVAPGQGLTLPEALALAPAGAVHFYEYTKAGVTGPLGLQAQASAGFDVTASLAADRPGGIDQALAAVAAGFRVAVPAGFAKGQPLPDVLILRNSDSVARLLCIDGDTTDHRWADPAGPQPFGFDGVAVLLRTKRSRGKGPEADAFSLAPVIGEWQPLAGGGQAAFSTTQWEA